MNKESIWRGASGVQLSMIKRRWIAISKDCCTRRRILISRCAHFKCVLCYVVRKFVKPHVINTYAELIVSCLWRTSILSRRRTEVSDRWTTHRSTYNSHTLILVVAKKGTVLINFPSTFFTEFSSFEYTTYIRVGKKRGWKIERYFLIGLRDCHLSM